MEEHAITFAGGATATSLSPIVLGALLLAIILILLLPRKYVMWPVFFMIFMSPMGQQVYLAGVHFYIARIIVLVGLGRIVFAKLSSQSATMSEGLNSIDRVFTALILTEVASVSLLFHTVPAIVNQFGFLLDYLGGYFLIRFMIQNEEDIYGAVNCLACLAIIIGPCMVYESRNMHNLFSAIGGQAVPEIRDGRVRAQGPFNQELMAGAFGATLLPLCLMLWKTKKAKLTGAFGMIGASLMAWTSNSSTSLLAIAAGVVAICFWPLRKSMRVVRWAIVFGLIVVQLIMKAPIWFFIAHIDLTGGSSSYHRAALIDQFIRHFGDWWLVGVRETGSWGLDMWDAQNQFVNIGVTGGLLGLIIFISLISKSFARLGNARKAIAGDRSKEWFLWILGSALFANVVAFFGVNYFDMTKFAWFALLALISAATAPIFQTSLAPEGAAGIMRRNVRLAYPTPVISRSVAPGPSQSGNARLKPRIL